MFGADLRMLTQRAPRPARRTLGNLIVRLLLSIFALTPCFSSGAATTNCGKNHVISQAVTALCPSAPVICGTGGTGGLWRTGAGPCTSAPVDQSLSGVGSGADWSRLVGLVATGRRRNVSSPKNRALSSSMPLGQIRHDGFPAVEGERLSCPHSA